MYFNLMSNFKKLYNQKINRFIYKKLSPLIGRILDKLFFTSFSRVGINYYHFYNRNDYYIENKDKICFIHLPKTGGVTIWNSLRKYNAPIYNFPKNSFHNPVSMYCNPKDYKYLTVMRNPIDRVYSQFFMYKKLGESIADAGLAYTIRTQKAFKNLACQYYSGFIDEVVDERIYEIAKNNLDKFHYIINFHDFENDLKKYLSNYENNAEILINHSNKSNYKKISNQEKELIESYNYWDIKLFEYYKNKL